jgi:hypothetical protein
MRVPNAGEEKKKMPNPAHHVDIGHSALRRRVVVIFLPQGEGEQIEEEKNYPNQERELFIDGRDGPFRQRIREQK